MIAPETGTSTNGAVSSAPDPSAVYPSLEALRTRHSELLKQSADQRHSPAFQDKILEFMEHGRATGALLDDDERAPAQSLLDYWTTVLYRVGREPPDATLVEFDPALAPTLDDARCPYVGLDPFRDSTSGLFFGRRRLIAEWVNRVKTDRFLIAVGPSGSGKSSLVLGGLLPALMNGAVPGSERWHYYPPMVPGSEPLAALARATQPTGVAAAAWTRDQAARYLSEPGCLARQLAEPDGAPGVIVVDQFEELFTLCLDEQARRAFVDNLLAVIDAPDARHTVIVSMRSDFEDLLADMPDLQARCEQARAHVTTLTRDELHEAIEKPAALVGLKIEQRVVDELVKDMVTQMGGLPLLQFTLLKLWESRDHNRVTYETYRRVGNARYALARSADAFYRQLIPQEQIAVKRILLRMARPGEGSEVTSNRIRVETLYGRGEDNGRIRLVLDKLVQARLVRRTAGDTPADDQVEVAHEALAARP